MKRRNIMIAGTAALAATGLGAGLGLAGGGASAATTAAKTAPAKVVYNCAFKPVVKPSSLVMACADDGIGLTDLHWTSWTPQLASGYGTSYENDCTPSCAAGHFHKYSVLVTLWGSGTVKGHPADRRYTELTLIYDGKSRPAATLTRTYAAI